MNLTKHKKGFALLLPHLCQVSANLHHIHFSSQPFAFVIAISRGSELTNDRDTTQRVRVNPHTNLVRIRDRPQAVRLAPRTIQQ